MFPDGVTLIDGSIGTVTHLENIMSKMEASPVDEMSVTFFKSGRPVLDESEQKTFTRLLDRLCNGRSLESAALCYREWKIGIVLIICSYPCSRDEETKKRCGDKMDFQNVNPELFIVVGELLGNVIANELPFNVQNAVGNWLQLVGQAIETYNAQQQYYQQGPGRFLPQIVLM